MDYWNDIKTRVPYLFTDNERFNQLIGKLESEIDEHQEILNHIQEHFQNGLEPSNYFSGALLSHLLWHYNHSIMFHVSLKLVNLSSAYIHLRVIFDNLASLLFILSEQDKREVRSERFFMHSKSEGRISSHPWYKTFKYNNKDLNLCTLCRLLTQYSQQEYKYNMSEKYSSIFRDGSIFIHPSSAWTGQWWMFDEKKQKHMLGYCVETRYFENIANEALQVFWIIKNIYKVFKDPIQ
jgi:hypothetical protein